MIRSRTSWAEKLSNAERNSSGGRRFQCEKTGKSLVIPDAREIQAIIRQVPAGNVITMQQLGNHFAIHHQVDQCCPLTLGIFTSIIARAASEEEGQTAAPSTPWWRVLKTCGDLSLKYPGEGAIQRNRLTAEGHCVIEKGKRLLVEGYEYALVDF